MQNLRIMRSVIFALVSMFAITLQAQDIVTYKTGETMKAKVIEIGEKTISYKRLDNLNGPSYTIDKSKVASIVYENGSVDSFAEVKKAKEDASKNEKSEEIPARRIYWNLELGGGITTVMSSNELSPYSNLGPAFGFDARIDFNEFVSVSFGERFSHHSFTTKSCHESVFITNWDERPTVMPEDGWKQKVKFSSSRVHANLMFNPFGYNKSIKHFKGYVYGGFGLSVNTNSKEHSTTEFFEIGLHPTVFLNKHWSLFLDLNEMFIKDDFAGYSEACYFMTTSVLLGIGFRI